VRLTLLIIAWVLSGASALPADSPSVRTLLPPPEDCLTRKIAGHTFVVGEIYLSAHADTALLTPYGFRKFEFQGWSLGRVHYNALWPVDVPLESLPPQLDELTYKIIPPPLAPEDGQGDESEDVSAPSDPGHSKSNLQSYYEEEWRHGVVTHVPRMTKDDSPPARLVRDANGVFYDADKLPEGFVSGEDQADEADGADPYYGYAGGSWSDDSPATQSTMGRWSRVMSVDPYAPPGVFSTSISRTTLTPTPNQMLSDPHGRGVSNGWRPQHEW
jgi:hypothetical protein